MTARSRARALPSLLRAVAGGAWRDHPGRLALSVLGIALGVALGVAVHLINAAASNEFDIAVRALSGEADLVVRGPRGGFAETLYPRIARLPGVQAASPAVEIDAQLAGRRETLKVLGLDPFRALQVQPHLLLESRDAIVDLLQPRQVLLSRPAAEALGLAVDGALRLQAGSRIETLRVAGILPAGATRQRIAVIDIAEAQRLFGRVGDLHRIDLKLAPGTSTDAFAKALARELPAGTIVVTPEAEAERNTSLTRAYRTNLDMLALVALFTGAFLVFSTQFLALIRRRAQLALLRVIGVTRGQMLRLLVLDGAITGLIGSTLGVAIGLGLAQFAIERLGGDLGAGLSGSVAPRLAVEPYALAAFFVLGLAFSTLGAALPALEAARREPALALKPGDEEEALRGVQHAAPGLVLVAAGLALSQAPPLGDVPVAGYAAIALILLGAILVMPRFASVMFARLPFLAGAMFARLPGTRYAPASLAAAQLQATPRQVAVALAGILASFSLMVSMLIMIGSFRTSLETWLAQMLPADLYVRAGRLGDSGYLDEDEQSKIARVNGVTRAVFIRSQNVFVRADRVPVSLIARPLAAGERAPPLPFVGATVEPRSTRPLEGATVEPAADAPPPVWLSEVAADLLHANTGSEITLPIGGAVRRFTVGGIWRDYARQNGAIVIDRATYTQMTGDRRANEAALFLSRDATPDRVAAAIRAALAAPEGIEIATTRELKTISLAIFDRTFAVTYALEIAAVMIGLFGVSASFSAQALARRREFGVLRHVGMTRRQIGAMLACEGVAVGAVGVAAGLALGWLISVILVHVINRQSFHWSMDMHVPWLDLAVLAASLIAAATLTAVVSGRRAMSFDATRAVREDW